MQRMLPNVYQEIHECLFDGMRLVVKNTFVDIDDAGSKAPAPMTRSLPLLPPLRRLLDEGEGDENLNLGAATPLNEVRARVFSRRCSGDLSLHADAATASCSDASLSTFVESLASDASSHSSRSRLSQERSERQASLSLSVGCSDADAGASSPSQQEEEMRTTTFMIRSLPRYMTRTKLEELLDAAGFEKEYDFIYLPANLKVKECFGYGFINVISTAVATRFVKHFTGYSWPDLDQEPMAVHESQALEGLDVLIQRYRNSPLMHESVPEEVRPAIYRNGLKVPFPSPTATLRAPRMRSMPGQKEQK